MAVVRGAKRTENTRCEINIHQEWDGAQLNKLMGDTLDGLNRIADYHREW